MWDHYVSGTERLTGARGLRSVSEGGWQLGRPGCGVCRLVPLRGGPGGENARPWLRWVRLRERLTAGPCGVPMLVAERALSREGGESRCSCQVGHR